MESIAVPIRDKKMIIWNFMEELWRKYQDATNDGRQPTFHLNDFQYIDVFEKYLPMVGIQDSNTDDAILSTLQQYERRGYFKIENDIVTVTERGLVEYRKPIHDWD